MERAKSSLSEAVYRFGGSVLIDGCIVFSAIWLNSVGGLGWFTTALTVAVFAFIRSYTRRTAILTFIQNWLDGFEQVYAGIREIVPWFREESFFRVVWSIFFGALIATLELGVLGLPLFDLAGWDENVKRLLSMAIVLIPAHAVVGLLTMRQENVPPSWSRKISQGLVNGFHIQNVQLTGVPLVLASALIRGLASVLVRALALLVLPLLVISWPGVAGLLLGAFYVSYMWDKILDWFRRQGENSQSVVVRSNPDVETIGS